MVNQNAKGSKSNKRCTATTVPGEIGLQLTNQYYSKQAEKELTFVHRLGRHQPHVYVLKIEGRAASRCPNEINQARGKHLNLFILSSRAVAGRCTQTAHSSQNTRSIDARGFECIQHRQHPPGLKSNDIDHATNGRCPGRWA